MEKKGQKEAKFVYYITNVIERSNSITIAFRGYEFILETSFLKLWYYAPFLIPRSDVILKLDKKRPKFVYLVLLVKKGQNSQVMKHEDE